MAEFTHLKWYNSQFRLFRKVKSCLRGNSYILSKLENNLEAVYNIWRLSQTVCVILSQFKNRRKKNHPRLVLVKAHVCVWANVGLSVTDVKGGLVQSEGRRGEGKEQRRMWTCREAHLAKRADKRQTSSKLWL